MSAGFAKVRSRRGGGAKKLHVTVQSVAEDKTFLNVVEPGDDKKPFKLYQKDGTQWQRVPVGSDLLISGMDKHADGFAPVYLDYGNRYPGIDRFGFMQAVSLIRVEPKDDEKNAFPRVRTLDPSKAVLVEDTSADGIKQAVEEVLGKVFVPSMPSDRSFIIRWLDKDGVLQNFQGSEDFSLAIGVSDETDEKGYRIPNNPAARMDEISAGLLEIIKEEVETNGSSKFEFIPQVTQFGSRSLIDPRTNDAAKLAKMPFPTADSQYVVAKGVSETSGREWKNWGIQPSYITFKPIYDKEKLLSALDNFAEKMFAAVPSEQQRQDMKENYINGFYVGNENLNSSAVAMALKKENIDPQPFQTGWVVSSVVPEGYPSPIPVAAVHTENHQPEYEAPSNNANAGQAQENHAAAGPEENEISQEQQKSIEQAAADAALNDAFGGSNFG